MKDKLKMLLPQSERDSSR